MLKEKISRIFFLAITAVCWFSCTKEDPQDARWQFCNNTSMEMPGDPCFCIHPFPTDSGYVFAIPQDWEQKIDSSVLASVKSQDSISILYTKLNSIFINTESGSMEAIHASKNHEYKESGIIKIINGKGEIVLSDTLKYIKGRGNSSWLKEKKSYNIKVSHKCTPLGLKESSKFNLVSTRGTTNRLALQIAQDFETSSAISFSLTNLYLNGEYKGLFLLTNKVEASKSSVAINDLDKKNKKDKSATKCTIEQEDGSYKYVSGLLSPKDITGGYIIEVMNFKPKYKALPCGFISDEGNKIRFKAPEEATEEEVLYIKNLYNEMYAAIKAPDGKHPATGRYYSDIINLESFARYYLIEESLSNMDGGYGNLYLYKNQDCIDSKIYLGPVWDMEWSMGLNDYPYFSYPNAVNLLAGSTDENQKLFCYLYQHDDFRHMVDSLYQHCLYPLLDSIFIPENVSADIDNDARINYLRWTDIYKSATEEFSHLCSYMRPHIDFLKEIYTNKVDEEFSTVKINAGYSKRNIMFFVRKGEPFRLPELLWFSSEGKIRTKDGWYEEGKPLTDSIITIEKDRFLELKWKD